VHIHVGYMHMYAVDNYAVHKGGQSSREYTYSDHRPDHMLRRSHTHRNEDIERRIGRQDNLNITISKYVTNL